MATGTGSATITFPASPQAAEYITTTVVTDTPPNPNILNPPSWNSSYTKPSSLSIGSTYANAVDSMGRVVVPSSFLVYASTDFAKSWFTITTPNIIGGSYASARAYGNGIYMSICQSATLNNIAILTIADDLGKVTEYTGPAITAANYWSMSLAFGAGLFVIYYDDYNTYTTIHTPMIWTSPDGITWTSRTITAINDVGNAVEFINGTFYIFMNTVTYTSTDGITWTQNAVALSSGGAVLKKYNPVTGKYFYIDGSSNFVVSDNLVPVVNAVSTPLSSLNGFTSAVEYFNGLYWIFPTYKPTLDTHGIMYSSDAINWTEVTMPVADSIFASLVVGTSLVLFCNNSNTELIWDITSTYTTATTRNISTVNTQTKGYSAAVSSNEASIAVTGQTNINTTDAAISAYISGQDSTIDHTAEEHINADIKLSIDNIIPGTGFTINATSTKRLEGSFKVRYAWAVP